MRVFVYRNRHDDIRPRSDMHFCQSCGGWYGVPHDLNHCQRREAAAGLTLSGSCACRFCRELHKRAVAGDFGFWTEAKRWQP